MNHRSLACLAALAVAAFSDCRPAGDRTAAAADKDALADKPGWEKLAAGPKARYALPIVWDAHKKRVLLFGGESNPDFKFWDDLWAFSPEKGEWAELKPEGKKPAKRAYFGASFDTKRKGMWLHGGFNPAMLGDLWFFDSEKEAWSEIVVKGDKPSPRDAHDLFYNPKTDELILFGGLRDFAKFDVSDELWVFDIAKGSWSKKATGPSPRCLYCGALDADGQRLFVSGGFGKGGEGVTGELWTYDIAKDKWSSAKEETRNYAAGRMAVVSDPARLLIFGGGDTNTEAWYDFKTGKWTEAEKAAPAPARSYHGMCLDTESRRVFVFGGTTKGFAGPHVAPELWALKLPAAPKEESGQQKEPEAADHARAKALVEKLAADSFETREDASARLQKMGKAAVKALEAGTESKDSEVSDRCKRLLALATRTDAEVALDALLNHRDTRLIFQLPAYERFKRIFGEDQAARTLYIDIYTREGVLLAGTERDPKWFEAAFRDRCRQVQQDMIKGFGRNQPNPVSAGHIEGLLFAGADARVTAEREAFVALVHMLGQEHIRNGFKESAAARKVLAEFLKLHADRDVMEHAMHLAMEYDLKELADTALKVATDRAAPAYQRGTCLVALGHLGTREHGKAVEPLLTDATKLGELSFRDAKVTAELRDAALGALILLNGLDPQGYDFPYLKATRQAKELCRSFTYFGFTDDKQREAALKKFKEALEKKARDDERK
jgi:hypothetical protein